jgi:hypothetical protein
VYTGGWGVCVWGGEGGGIGINYGMEMEGSRKVYVAA